MARAGSLRHQVRFERRKTERAGDGAGNFASSEIWVGIEGGKVSAEIVDVSGGEQVKAARLAGVSAHEITVRGWKVTRAVQTSDRAVNTRTGVVYALKHVRNPDGRGDWLTFTAQSGEAPG